MRAFSPAALRAAMIALPITLGLSVPASAADDWKPLLSPTELQSIVADGEVRVVDIRAGKTKDGKPHFETGHVPGAVSAPYGEWRGPQENPGKLPPQDKLIDLVQGLGIEADIPVVVVHEGADATDFGAAARVYWTLKSLGVSQIAILNGGFENWKKAGLPLSTDRKTVERSDFQPEFAKNWLATSDEVLEQVEGQSEARLLDARPKGFFEGRLWHVAAHRPGTLPTADNFSHEAWFVDGGPILKEEAAVANIVEDNGLGEATTTVSFCNTGHWAATNWFVLSEVAGLQDVRLYPESMVGWSAANLPMANVPGRLEWLWMSTKKWVEDFAG